jgi:hypothetical protein
MTPPKTSRLSPLSEFLTQWEVSEKAQKELDRYYLLYWQGNYFWSQNQTGELEHQGEHYQIIYHGCLPRDIRFNTRVALSFRLLEKDKYPYLQTNHWETLGQLIRMSKLSSYILQSHPLIDPYVKHKLQLARTQLDEAIRRETRNNEFIHSSKKWRV